MLTFRQVSKHIQSGLNIVYCREFKQVLEVDWHCNRDFGTLLKMFEVLGEVDVDKHGR